jgi:hypothetical protein
VIEFVEGMFRVGCAGFGVVLAVQVEILGVQFPEEIRHIFQRFVVRLPESLGHLEIVGILDVQNVACHALNRFRAGFRL